MARWMLTSGTIRELATAADQWAAFDTLRDRSPLEFGLIVAAEPNEQGEGESIPVRTSLLMTRWGRSVDAKAFVKAAVKAGMPNSTRADRKACAKKQ